MGRKCFYNWVDVAGEVAGFVVKNRDSVDHVTFVPDGEPTPDACLGRIIEFVKRNWCQSSRLNQRSLLLLKIKHAGTVYLIRNFKHK